MLCGFVSYPMTLGWLLLPQSAGMGHLQMKSCRCQASREPRSKLVCVNLHDRSKFFVKGNDTYLCANPRAKSSVPSTHPVLKPGPAILLKLPLLTAFPNPSVPSLLSAPPSKYLSTSTIRGTIAVVCVNTFFIVAELVGEADHWRKS